jgi:formylglycine-generating enzyme required for sulfatase activity/tRNA A-37 threonylcarbamoyl transferase component Bud32
MSCKPGDILLDKYRIEALIASGSYGEVYRVIHLDLNITRVIKILLRDAPGIGSSDYNDCQARFMVEARLGAQLNSPTPNPHLLQIHDSKFTSKLNYLEMEYTPGGSLAERLKKCKETNTNIPVTEAVQIALDVCAGLATLHARDIVHRDLKPSNILFDENGNAKVADLGLVQSPDDTSRRILLSQPPPHPGSPAYMSPEQENPPYPLLTPASDVFALAVILFEMLTGRNYKLLRPGKGMDVLDVSVPGWLKDVLQSMLEKDKEKRPWDGAEAGELLRAGIDSNQEQEKQSKAQVAEAEKIRLEEEHKKLQAAIELKARLDAEENTRVDAHKKAEEQSRQDKTRQEAEEKARIEAEERNNQTLILTLAPGVEMEFVCVTAGEFLMGSDPKRDQKAEKNEQPQHKIYLDEYLIGKYPVTNRQYQTFVKASGYKTPCHWKNGAIPQGKEKHPVVSVSWKDAFAFCEWTSRSSGVKVRLPSEAEWEKAARGIDGRLYPWGDQAPDAKRCNYNMNIKNTTSLGRYSPQGDSPYGCVDMAGNVWEWVNDWINDTFYQNSPASNPNGPASGKYRVLRGGSWDGLEGSLRSANRTYVEPVDTSDGIGFRCARNLKP